MGRKRKRRNRKMGRWILGIGCMLISAGVFASVIYFSNAGHYESGQEEEKKVETQTKEKKESETEINDTKLEKKLEQMSLEEKVAQMFLITPDELTGVEGTWNPGEVTRNAYKTHPVGGLIMEPNNLVSSDQIKVWNDTITGFSKEAVGVNPFLAVDEEGGTMSWIAQNQDFGIENVGNMSEIGASQDSKKAYEAGRTIGSYLKELGFNLDLAPVANVIKDTSEESLQYRSFGSDPEVVSEMVSEEIKGYHNQGISTVTKYFPGLGSSDTAESTGILSVKGTREELEECEFLPFQAAIKEETEFIMVGNSSLPDILEDDTPASLSEEVVTQMLREDLGFQGIIITDAMDEAVITDRYSSEDAALQALQAGADMIFMPQNFEDAYEGVLSAVHSGTVSEKRIDESVKRILKVKMRESEEGES